MKRKLTGKTRHRLHKVLFHKPLIVVQVEIKEGGNLSHNAGGFSTTPVFTRWADAKVEDLFEIYKSEL